MGFFSRFSKPRGGLILPRGVARQAQLNWPKCCLCGRALDAYGIEGENSESIEIWGRCDGVRHDPDTGRAVHGSERNHPVLKSSMTIVKGPTWSPNTAADLISRLAFFAPDAASEGREVTQTLDAEGVRKKWTV